MEYVFEVKADAIFAMDLLFNGGNVTNSSISPNKSKRPPRKIRLIRLDMPEEGAALRKALYGQVIPVLTLLFVIINVLMLFIFYKGKFRSGTHMILAAIAVADMLNGITVLIPAMHFYTLNNDLEYMTYQWCWPYFIVYRVLARLSHGSSLMYTVLLAMQRYIFVKLPFRARIICSKRNILIAIGCVPLIALATHGIFIYQESTFYGVYVNSRLNPTQKVYACAKGRPRLSFEAVVWTENFLQRIVPLTTLVFLDALLIIELSYTTKYVQHKMTASSELQMKGRVKKNRRITLLTVLVVVSVLITEVPGFIAQLVITYSQAIKCKGCILKTHVALFQVAITVLYPSNFLVYCFVSEKFRKTCKNFAHQTANVLCPYCIGKETQASALSVSTSSGENGTATDDRKTESNMKSTSV